MEEKPITSVKKERVLRVVDLVIVIVLYLAGCMVGQEAYEVAGSWLAFIGAELGMLVVGGMIWVVIRRRIMK